MSDKRDKTTGQFLAGNSGKPVGTRNKLQAEFVKSMQADFEENGADVIKIVRVERPADYLKILASILPKEMVLTGDVLNDMSDDELKDAIATVRRLKAVA